jgi:hypothetical protein
MNEVSKVRTDPFLSKRKRIEKFGIQRELNVK